MVNSVASSGLVLAGQHLPCAGGPGAECSAPGGLSQEHWCSASPGCNAEEGSRGLFKLRI